MFKIGLLTSTAMTAVALLLSGAPHEAQAQTAMHVADQDANARFLCTYGQFAVSFGFSKIYSASSSTWEHVAVPITGGGQTVSQITVMETRGSRTDKTHFTAGIYSSNKQGFPGKLIAGGRGQAPHRCAPVTISITPTTLKAETKYWIEERAPQGHKHYSAFALLEWAVDPKAKRNGYVQRYKHSCFNSSHCSNSKSPWTKQSSGPWFRLK